LTSIASAPPVTATLEAARRWLEAARHRLGTFELSAYQVAIVSAMLLGVCVRAFHVLSFDFPVNDGGLFYQMTQDLQEANYLLPANTSYNGGEIPLSYPPFAFYVSGLLDDLTPLSLLEVYRYLPLLATCLTLPAFYLLARSLLPSKVAVLFAVLAFALIPRSFMWLLMGGGVTRSLGLLFALLALHQAYRLYAQKKGNAAWILTALCALTVLTHLETGWFLAFSIGLFFVAFGRDKQSARYSVLIVLWTVILTAPWWWTSVARHGLDPFLAATGSGGSVFEGGESTRDAYLGLLQFVSTSEPLFPIWGVLAFIGGVTALITRRWLLPVWWLLIIILDVRAYPTFTTLPLAMLAGIAVSDVVFPAVKHNLPLKLPANWRDGINSVRRGDAMPFAAPAAVFLGLLVFATVAALLRDGGLSGEGMHLRSISSDERAAMAWVRQRTPESSKFLIVPESSWETARTAEWFPVLADRRSVTTVQGSEWMDDGEFERASRIYDQAFECGYRTTSCLGELAVDAELRFSHVYVPKHNGGQCCYTLVDSLLSDPAYQVVYDSLGATIFAVRPYFEPGSPQAGRH
jgi:hypothetical protein